MGRGEGGVGFLPQRKYGSPWSLILTGVFGLFLLLYDYEYNYFIFKICSWLGNKKSLLQTLGMESQGGLWSSCTFHACSLVRCSHRLSIFFKPIFLPMLMLIVKISRILMSMLVINLILMQILTNNNCRCLLCFRENTPCRICVCLEGKPARL